MLETLHNSGVEYLPIQESLSQGGWLVRTPQTTQNETFPFHSIVDVKSMLKLWTSQINTQQNTLAGAQHAKTDHSMQIDAINPFTVSTDPSVFTTNGVISAHSISLLTHQPMQSMMFDQVLTETITEWRLNAKQKLAFLIVAD